MNRNHKLGFFKFLRSAGIILLVLVGFIFYPINTAFANTSDDIYKQKSTASADGIGKVYMGREISQVMGH